MIARIRGNVIEKTSNSLVVDVNGVGYEILAPANLIETTLVDQELSLVTYHHVRENSQDLFGFNNEAGKQLFEMLISVSGVGPKSALNIMSLGDENTIRKSIAQENIAVIAGASGIGKRTAERICVELKDKVGIFHGYDSDTKLRADDAVSALVALGFSQSQAALALKDIDPNLSLEDRVKLALKEKA